MNRLIVVPEKGSDFNVTLSTLARIATAQSKEKHGHRDESSELLPVIVIPTSEAVLRIAVDSVLTDFDRS